MSSDVENRPAEQRQGNRRRGGNSTGRNRQNQSRNKQNLDPRRRLAESKAKRQEFQQQPSMWQRFVGFLTGKTAAGGDNRPSKPATSTKSPQKKRSAPQKSSGQSEKRRQGPDLDQRIAEVSGPKLYVGNLSYDATEEHLEELFGGVGKVDTAEVVSHRRTQRSKGFAFVHMSNTDEAKRAVEILHDKEFMGRKLIVSGARSDQQPASAQAS